MKQLQGFRQKIVNSITAQAEALAAGIFVISLLLIASTFALASETTSIVHKGTDVFSNGSEHSIHSSQTYIQDDAVGIFSGVSILATKEDVYSNEWGLGVIGVSVKQEESAIPKAPSLTAIGSNTTNINKVQVLVISNKPVKNITIYENDKLLGVQQVDNAISFIIGINLSASPGQKIIKAKIIDNEGKESPLSDKGLVYNLEAKVLTPVDSSVGVKGLTAKITVPVGALDIAAEVEINTNPIMPIAGIPVPKVDEDTGQNIGSVNFVKAIEIDLVQPTGSSVMGKVAINTHLDITLEIEENFDNPENVRIFYFDPELQEWLEKGITVLSVVNNQVVFRTTHLTLFAIAEVELMANTAPSFEALKIDNIAVVANDYISGRPSVNIVATDDSKVVSYRIQVLDQFSSLVSGNDSLTKNIPVSANRVTINELIPQTLGSGSYYIRVSIIDDNGVVSTRSTALVRVADAVEALSLTEVLSAPNPVNTNTQTAHIGYQLSKAATVRLYIHSLNGDLLYSASQQSNIGYGEFLWTGVNNAGEKVANGGYLAYVVAESGGQRTQKLVKIGVLR